MDRKKAFYCLLIFGLIITLGGCQNTPPTSPPIPTVINWRASLSPSIEWIQPHLNVCTLQNAGAAVLLVTGDEEPDINFFWGNADQSAGKKDFILGSDQLTFIVNPRNQISEIKMDTLRSILSGTKSSWKDLTDPSALDSAAIKAANYPPALDIQRALIMAFGGDIRRNTFSTVLSSPAATRIFVAQNSNAIGFLPSRWFDGSVRPVKVVSDQPLDLNFPIIAETRGEPGGDLNKLLLCVQNAIKLETASP